ncbi:hypothetical protein DIPPA_30546 [Diplonema papillatum]|nr:hypothetical protein DIPPA_30546 [Diplonema papillatum]
MDGMSPLTVASSRAPVEVIVQLLQAGAAVNGEGRDRGTALMEASHRGRPGAVDVLLHAGAQVDGTDSIGDTALMKASRAGHWQVAQLLLAAGASTEGAGHYNQLFEEPRQAGTHCTALMVAFLVEDKGPLYGTRNSTSTALYILSKKTWF